MPAPCKTVVLCFDGTWNNLDSHTNVARMYSEIGDESTGCKSQRKFYDEGVGTHSYDRLTGGMFGAGLDVNIRLGYAWLASVYEAADAASTPPGAAARKPNGDRVDAPLHSSGAEFEAGSDIYIFGFSRGAFTARSLGGMINYLGIPRIDPAAIDPRDQGLADHPLINDAWDLYVARPTDGDRKNAIGDPLLAERIRLHDEGVAAFRGTRSRFPVRIHFMGVWDTVGALGIPRIFDVEWIPRFSTKYRFHDTALGESIRNAYHAIAIDENRLPYTATLWTRAKPTTEGVEQRWFPGAHADVGGGYPDSLLPAPPLQWLAAKAASCGLEFVNDRRIASPDGSVSSSVAIAPAAFDLDGTEYLSPVHDSYAEFLFGAYRIVRSIPGMGGRVYRRMLVPGDGIGQSVDPSAFAKWKADPEYRPPNLGQAGRSDVSFNIAKLSDDELPGTLAMRSIENPGA